jgi:hypothetical protein
MSMEVLKQTHTIDDALIQFKRILKQIFFKAALKEMNALSFHVLSLQ